MQKLNCFCMLDKIINKIPIAALDGVCLEIYPDRDNHESYYEVDISEANRNGESPYQILEGHSYEYYLSSNKYRLKDNSTIVKTSKKDKSQGRIVPNIYVGTLTLDILDVETGERVAQVDLEVRSVKSSYRQDYRFMLEDITEKCTDLLMQCNSPVSQNFSSDFENDSETLYQRFAFVHSLLSSDEFSEAVLRIISSPVTQWKENVESIDIRRVRRIRNSGMRQIATNSNRIELDKSHPLYSHGITSVPQRIQSSRKIENVDTAENRFVKYALEEFLRFCDYVYSKASGRVKQEASNLVNKLETVLSNNLFKHISRPDTLKLNSPILQRKEGYREVLRAWIMYDLAAKLSWEGGDDVYKAGKRDVATLYEYWLFFTLLDLFKDIFSIEPKSIDELIKGTSDGLGLQLKQGKHTALEGIYDAGTRKLRVRFSYNRSFSGGKDYPRAGSWTTTMRPDYTLAIWPASVKEKEAEEQELIVYIHFDAKYKINNFYYNVEEYLDSDKEDEKNGRYKNADLLKMHAYKDAIRRTAGAYVLYPGEQALKRTGFRELIPGLGAFPVRPSRNNSGIGDLKGFVNEVLEHFINRASQRESMSYRTYDIYKQDSKTPFTELIPEAFGDNRGLIPSETSVLVGYYKSVEHLKWCKEKSLYNFRMGDGRGSLVLTKEVVSAKYILMYTAGEESSSELWKIVGSGPRIFSKEIIKEQGYPSEPSQDSYIVFDIEKCDIAEFGNASWKAIDLKGYQTGDNLGVPFAVSMVELMRVKV